MVSKKQSRLKRAKKIRGNIAKQKKVRLSVHRSVLHIEAQLIDQQGKVLGVCSSKQKDFRVKHAKLTKVDQATKLGEMIAKIAQKAKVEDVAFDRSGFRYHGRIKALADAARDAGLKF